MPDLQVSHLWSLPAFRLETYSMQRRRVEEMKSRSESDDEKMVDGAWKNYVGQKMKQTRSRLGVSCQSRRRMESDTETKLEL